jgi:hypothetical protein
LSADEGIEIINSFIKISESIEKLPRLTLPEYRNAARDLAKICYKILNATKIAISWFNCFSNFQFIGDPVVTISNYQNLVGRYRQLKFTGTFRKLDLVCGDIRTIYTNNLERTLNELFSDELRSKKDDVRGIFEGLSSLDNNMVAFVSKYIVSRLDNFTDSICKTLADGTYYSDVDRLKVAEQRKLEFNRESRDILNQLTQINDSLIDLVIKFAGKTSTGISSIFDPSDFTEPIQDVC